ncbi:AraC family transcriptional regulator [Paenibacillus alkaliterrae]|uniref:AraC family transcriptional regulator n=1 Tax=Paenibacillus alkaliterrae TaxID=320909 RepID=UPI001F2BBF0B|nr:AraC family transcriptional regulator [Paenibacillus alkaliterrae]MCF2937961.1 AraC family transcriptional regulator [Paenibacillus alkaliterrae]
MKPIRKQFDAAASFPLEFTYRAVKDSHNELPNHLHDWHEIVYVHAGKGVFFIDGSFYAMSPGDLFLLPGNTIHRALPEEEAPLTVSAIYFHGRIAQWNSLGDTFSYIQCFEQANKWKSHKLCVDSSDRDFTEAMLVNINSELSVNRPGQRHAVVLHLLHLLLLLNRQMPVPTAERKNTGAPEWMRMTLRTIDEQPFSDVSLSTLSVKAAVNPSHFTRVFKLLTGMTLTEYVTAKRISRAKELLLSSDAPIHAIANECGFESLPHFHRTFKKLTGTTPAGYKRSCLTPGIHHI